ncbi:hypothetical protein [Rhodococcus pyridinivorans]|uniref:hypothetical protein n=1 Tax=Rhodococcus pyridinivorans TaxID=103816 RepID=UPI0019066830|nr:hypothetical protein [Rhodococcus pyridinivorans]QQM52747.1 hypothetical protein JGU70_20120 [Rhodococcus pyridinivorans]
MQVTEPSINLPAGNVLTRGTGILVLQKTVDVRRADDGGAIALGFCLAVMTASSSAWGFERAGFHRFGVHPRIQQYRDDVHGPGIEIPYVRILPVQLSVVFSCMTVAGAFMITWLVRRGVSDVFVRWDEIREVAADVYTVSGSGASTHNPLIRLHVPGYEPTPPRMGHDKPDSLTVPAYVLVSEPHTLLGLVDRLHRCPEDRHLVTTPGAPELLRPLPVRERLRIARKIPRQQWEW